MQAVELTCLAHRRAAGAETAQGARVGLEVALQGQHTDDDSLSAHRFNSHS